jgi:hypothetical protein
MVVEEGEAHQTELVAQVVMVVVVRALTAHHQLQTGQQEQLILVVVEVVLPAIVRMVQQ